MAGIGVDPYWEVTFDANGGAHPNQADALSRSIGSAGVTDLVLFAHDWNNDHATATRVHRRFFTPFPALLEAGGATARVGYAGVFWPSLRFADEPVADHRPSPAVEEAAALAARQGLDRQTSAGLIALFPHHADDLGRMAKLLRERPEPPAALHEFFALLRTLLRTADHAAAFDTDESAGTQLAMVTHDPGKVCESFAAALERAGAEPHTEGARVWSGAREALRWTTHLLLKRRAGVIGEAGLGPLLCRISEAVPAVRIHLVGHSIGGRLVCFALRALPDAPGCVRSVTVLQGALSRYAFAERLPCAPAARGALHGTQLRIDGPLVACHSSYDDALGLLYPLASRPADAAARDERYAAIGFDGVRGVDGAVRLTLADTAPSAGRPFPRRGCVNVDAGSVVRGGFPPIGAHSDICHAGLGRVVLRAGRILG